MKLGSPWLLALSLAGVVLLLAYLWWLRRGRRSTTTFSSLGLLREAAADQKAWRRHVPVILVCVALVVLGVGAARPTVVLRVPSDDATVILALDVSGSMCNTDVTPNRLAAAQDAVRSFLQAQKSSGTKFGLVIFSSQAQLAVAPTTDTESLLKAIEGMTTGRGTVIGSAILTAVDAISEIDPQVSPTDASQAADTQTTNVTPAPPVPEIVVLLTDGANTRGVTPQQAAVQAAERGVRVYPIGFGTTSPKTMACTAQQVVNNGYRGGGFGGGPGGGGGFGGGFGGGGALVVDENALKAVAQITGAEYFSAASADSLNKVLDNVRSRLGTVTQEVDISAGPAVLGSLILLGAALVTLRRNPLG
ncbi:MAG TPA: VWA domain-containing protein [Propionibacteriaceae bacterium]|nr:VWA domain-containing protein [Propionibacteriaceae bacterium]